MGLEGLGFDGGWAATAAEVSGGLPDARVARVVAVDRHGGWVHDGEREVPFEPAGRLCFTAAAPGDLPSVGDWVLARYHDQGQAAIVHAVLPRRTLLGRKEAGKGTYLQVIAANVDVAFIVQSCHYDLNLRRLDRYLVMVREGGITPVLVLTKTDLVGRDDLLGLLAQIDAAGLQVTVIAVSNATGEGVDRFRESLEPGRTYVLVGSSGVGKSTLINQMTTPTRQMTREVSHTGEGVHTTVRRQLIRLDQGAMLVDTPGMREFGILASEAGVVDAFSDIEAWAATCRYADCRHGQEPGCAVRAAVINGELGEERLQHFLKLRREAGFHELSELERRRRGRAFGRMVKSAKKRRDGG